MLFVSHDLAVVADAHRRDHRHVRRQRGRAGARPASSSHRCRDAVHRGAPALGVRVSPTRATPACCRGRPRDLINPPAGLPLRAALPLRQGSLPRRSHPWWRARPGVTATPAGCAWPAVGGGEGRRLMSEKSRPLLPGGEPARILRSRRDAPCPGHGRRQPDHPTKGKPSAWWGESGCGKSTTGRAIVQVEHPSVGEDLLRRDRADRAGTVRPANACAPRSR